MQTGVFNEVAAGGGGNGGDITDVLHHRGDGDGRHDEDGGDVELCDDELLEANEVGLTHRDEVDKGLHDAAGIRQLGAAESGDHAEEDGDDLDHALAPDVGNHDDRHGNEREPPAGLGVGDGGAGEVQADHDDHGAGDNGREVTHDLLRAEELEEQRQHEVEEACDHNAAERVGELELRIHALISGERCDRGEAAEVGERGAEERGDLKLGADVEQQRA